MNITDQVIATCTDIEETNLDDGPLRRFIWIRPEYSCIDRCAHGSPNCRGRGSPGWHGISAREITWGIATPRGGVTFQLVTPIYPPDVAPPVLWHPLGPLVIHHAHPTHPDDYRSHFECEITGGACWPDPTYLQAEAGVTALLTGGGSRGVWAWLAEAWLPILNTVED